MAKPGAKNSKSNQYTVLFRRLESGEWTARVKELNGCHTMASSIELARNKIRRLLKQLDEQAVFATLVDEIALPVAIQDEVLHLRTRRQSHEEEALIIQNQTLKAAKCLQFDYGYSLRDIGAILGISHQRVQQLLAQPD